ncbi:hypothetical protein GXW74_11065 [Roseomonas eburnea]|uniref:DUF2799 domain-containing protein n=1 Tax=Neoroseomonas eburnea TaxID=1346889 RepID=A0A9X9XBE3_9PROT|nr:hypothetical protein [Neoroseomonas eburnea]MBR0681029.1 hypothetical protein [Neoroseomonas eburnea]
MRGYSVLVACLMGLAAAPAGAQVMYNGWNLGPDYGRMADAVEAQRRQQIMQMQQAEAQFTAQGMQDPVCQAHYRQHLAQGGQVPWPSFAFQCVATNRFDPESVRAFRQNELQNQRAEAERLAALREAERARGLAQGQHADSYGRGQAEAGRLMQGQQSWTDPRTGQTYALPYLGGPISQDPTTGQLFGRDAAGRQYALGRDGQWYPMRQGW